jgi:hypothetical protein
MISVQFLICLSWKILCAGKVLRQVQGGDRKRWLVKCLWRPCWHSSDLCRMLISDYFYKFRDFGSIISDNGVMVLNIVFLVLTRSHTVFDMIM